MSAGADDKLRRLWFELEHLQSVLSWGGGFWLGSERFDSMGRPTRQERGRIRPWHEELSRVERVRQALRDSGPKAQALAQQTLAGIELSSIWDVLIEACKDVALVYGGSVLAGAAVGGVGGALFGGVGAIPGAAAGAAAGAQVGAWVLALLGLKSLVEGLSDAIPSALKHYERGVREAWGPTPQDRRFYPHGLLPIEGKLDGAATELAHGHVILIAAILSALMAYLTRGRGDKAALLQEIRNSPRLGPRVADWVVMNEGKLVGHPALQPRREADGRGSNSQQHETATPRPAGRQRAGSSASEATSDKVGGAPHSDLVPGGGLAAHEARGGHLLARHVGKTESDLAARLAAEPRIGAASTFVSRAEAEAAISNALSARSADLNAWVTVGAPGRLVIEAPFDGGLVLQRGAAGAMPGTGVRAVLEGTGGGGWRIITGFPTP